MHTSVTRAFASWPGWSEPGFTGTFEDYVAEKFPSSQAGDFAVLESGVVSEDTYIEQGDYWGKLYQPLIKYILTKYKPDVAMVGFPGTDEVQHQFLGLVTKKLPNGADNPSYDDLNLDGKKDGRVKAARGVRRERLRRVRRDDAARPEVHGRPRPEHVRRLRPRLRAAVPGHRREQGARRPRAAAASRRRATAARRPARRSRKAKACYAGGALQVYLNLAGGTRRRHCRRTRRPGRRCPTSRSPRPTRRRDGPEDPRRVHRAQGPQRLEPRRPAGELEGHRPHVHQGRGPLHPERGRTAPPTWRTRPARATSWSSPTRRTSSTPPRPAR